MVDRKELTDAITVALAHAERRQAAEQRAQAEFLAGLLFGEIPNTPTRDEQSRFMQKESSDAKGN